MHSHYSSGARFSDLYPCDISDGNSDAFISAKAWRTAASYSVGMPPGTKEATGV